MTSAVSPPRLSDAALSELLVLLDGVDSVELKLSVPASGQRSAIDGLKLDPLDAQIRQVFFFDTPDLALYNAGVVVRARRVQGKGADTVVKRRPVIPGEVPRKLRRLPSFGVEVDAMPGGFVCSASLSRRSEDAGAVLEVVRGDRPLRGLLSKDQRAFFKDNAPADLTLDDLATLGPVFVLKLPFRPAGLGRKLVAEMWMYPDDSRILELSTKTSPDDAFRAAAETRAYLADRAVDLSGEQETKTRRALEFFSSRLAAEGEPD